MAGKPWPHLSDMSHYVYPKVFRSGVTAEEFTEIVDESHAQVVKQYGETIKVDDLTSVFFEANLRCIPEFKTICSQMAALPEEKQTFDKKKKLFVSALKHEGKINVDADAMQQAVFAMLKRALKTDVKMGGKGKGKERPFKNDRASRLGGAARNEGLNAFFAQGDHEDQGKGAKGGKGKKPPNACHICWKVGHYAHECTGTPHPNSTWVPPNPQPKVYRKGALVQFAEPALGGSFIKLKHSEEKIPIECVEGKYFRVMMDIPRYSVFSY